MATVKGRAAVRTVFTKMSEKFLSLFEKTSEEGREVDEEVILKLQNELGNVELLFAKLSKMDEEIFRSMCEAEETSEQSLVAELERVNEYREKFMECSGSFKLFMEKRENRGKRPTPSKSSTISHPALLPCCIKPFSGNLIEWLPFWTSFKVIHLNNSIKNEDKFTYLIQALVPESKAFRAVEKYPVTSENYQKAIANLEQMFGREDLLTEVYTREILKLVLNRQENVSRLYDSLETQLHALKSLGVTTDKYAAILYPIVESCLPEELLRLWQRQRYFFDDVPSENRMETSLQRLMDFLRIEVETMERVALATADFGEVERPKEVETSAQSTIQTAQLPIAMESAFIQANMVSRGNPQKAEKLNDKRNVETEISENFQHKNDLKGTNALQEYNGALVTDLIEEDNISNCDLLQENVTTNTHCLESSKYKRRKLTKNQFQPGLTTQDKHTVQYPTINSSMSPSDDPAGVMISLKARHNVHNETTHGVLHKEPLGKGTSKSNKYQKLKKKLMMAGKICYQIFHWIINYLIIIYHWITKQWIIINRWMVKYGIIIYHWITKHCIIINYCTIKHQIIIIIIRWIFKHLTIIYHWIIKNWTYIVTGLVIIIAWAFCTSCSTAIPKPEYEPMASPKPEGPTNNKMEFNFLDFQIDKLEDQYKNLPDDIWGTLSYCLESTLNGKQPCIILMLNGGEENFSKLLNDIGDLSVKLLKGSLNLLKGSTITKSEENYSFEHYKSMLKENKVLLIDELELVPGKIMENFHSLCDVYDAAVKQAVIVFLLNYKHITVDLNYEINDASIAINILSDLWKNSIHHDLINPLAIRVAENVLHLQQKS